MSCFLASGLVVAFGTFVCFLRAFFFLFFFCIAALGVIVVFWVGFPLFVLPRDIWIFRGGGVTSYYFGFVGRVSVRNSPTTCVPCVRTIYTIY